MDHDAALGYCEGAGMVNAGIASLNELKRYFNLYKDELSIKDLYYSLKK